MDCCWAYKIFNRIVRHPPPLASSEEIAEEWPHEVFGHLDLRLDGFLTCARQYFQLNVMAAPREPDWQIGLGQYGMAIQHLTVREVHMNTSKNAFSNVSICGSSEIGTALCIVLI
eukprot:2889489-Amphidinium_carterae.1